MIKKLMLTKEATLNLQSEDIVKFFLTLAVVFYHSIMAWSVWGWHDFSVQPINGLGYFVNFLGKFHTPSFTFLSGWLFYALRYEKGKYRNPLQDLKRRAKRLLLPYAVMLIWVVPFYFGLEGGNIKTAVFKYAFAGAPSQLWYLVMLFGVFCVFYFFSDFINKHPLFFAVGFYVLYGVASVLATKIPDFFQIWTILKSLIYFHYGFCVKKGLLAGVWKINPVWFILIYAILIFADYKWLIDTDNLIINMFSSAINPIISLLGITGFVNLFSKIDVEKFYGNKILRFINKYKFTIFLFHQQLVYILLSLFGETLNPLVLITINFIFSLFGALIISVVLSKIKIAKTIFGIN